MTKHYCDICGKEAELRPIIFNWVDVTGKNDIIHACSNCHTKVKEFIQSLRPKEGA